MTEKTWCLVVDSRECFEMLLNTLPTTLGQQLMIMNKKMTAIDTGVSGVSLSFNTVPVIKDEHIARFCRLGVPLQ